MIIEIKDREFYIKQCKHTLQRIEHQRAIEDAEYVASWRRQWPERYWRSDTDMPPSNEPFYPSIAGWRQYNTIEKVLAALESKNTGVIYITKEELDYLS